MRLLILLMLALPVWAHEGHDHDASAALVVVTQGTSRASAQTADLEVVAAAEGAKLTIYVDRFTTNEPLAGATIDIESGTSKVTATQAASGIYVATVPDLALPGKHPVTMVVQAGALNDLLTLSLEVDAKPAMDVRAQPIWRSPLAWTAGATTVLAACAVLLLATRRRRSAAVTVQGQVPSPAPSPAAGSGASAIGALALVACLLAAPGSSVAHGDDDHSADNKKPIAPTAAPGSGVSSESASARRLPDGSVFMPKAMQYALGLRHLLAQPGEHPMTIEFNGRVIADPNTSGRVQATQSGRIEAGPRGLPVIGQRVAKGQLLAMLRPSAGAIERGNQQALRAELDSLRAIAERRLKRLEQLEGAVPQKDIESARIELQALQQRSQAIGGGLAATEPLLAPVSGVISAIHVLAGQVVDARETIIDVVDPTRLAVEALAHEPVLPKDLASASIEVAGRDLPLVFVGAGRQLREQAMPLLFALRNSDVVLAVGQPLKVIARTSQRTHGVAVPRSAVVRLASGDLGVWVHSQAERFMPRRVAARSLDGTTLLVTAGIEKDERIVTEGASLLAQVR